jgi:hypothetical protein
MDSSDYGASVTMTQRVTESYGDSALNFNVSALEAEGCRRLTE